MNQLTDTEVRTLIEEICIDHHVNEINMINIDVMGIEEYNDLTLHENEVISDVHLIVVFFDNELQIREGWSEKTARIAITNWMDELNLI